MILTQYNKPQFEAKSNRNFHFLLFLSKSSSNYTKVRALCVGATLNSRSNLSQVIITGEPCLPRAHQFCLILKNVQCVGVHKQSGTWICFACKLVSQNFETLFALQFVFIGQATCASDVVVCLQSYRWKLCSFKRDHSFGKVLFMDATWKVEARTEEEGEEEEKPNLPV